MTLPHPRARVRIRNTLGRTTAPAQTKIYVGNVEPHITTEMIKTVFEPFGMVVGAEMVQDPSNPGNVSCSCAVLGKCCRTFLVWWPCLVSFRLLSVLMLFLFEAARSVGGIYTAV